MFQIVVHFMRSIVSYNSGRSWWIIHSDSTVCCIRTPVLIRSRYRVCYRARRGGDNARTRYHVQPIGRGPGIVYGSCCYQIGGITDAD